MIGQLSKVSVCLIAAIVALSHNSADAQIGNIIEGLIPPEAKQFIEGGRNRTPPPEQIPFSPIPGESGGKNDGPKFINPGWGTPPRNSRPPRTTYPPRDTYPRQRYRNVPTTPSKPPLTILCPKGQSGSCDYTLIASNGSYAFTLKPGFKQTLDGSTAWSIRYDGGAGERTYRLSAGEDYILQRNDFGHWQIYKKPTEVIAEPPTLPASAY